MIDWGQLFLGTIALATLVMAALQVGAVVYAARLGKRIENLTTRVERDLRPLTEHLEEMGRNAARASELAVAQVERADRAFADAAARFDATLGDLQSAMAVPMREGRALAAGIRAALGALGEMTDDRGARRGEEEEALFIG